MATPTPASSIRNLPSIAKKAPRPRDVLRTELMDVTDAVAEERAQAARAAAKAAELKAKIAYLEAHADEMKKTVADHNAFIQQKLAHEAKRTESLGHNGMMCFTSHEKFGVGDAMKPKPRLRNSRRTGFCTDYCGRAYLGECEWVESWQRQNRANGEIVRREEEASQRRDAALKAGTPEPSAKPPPLRKSQALPDLERMKRQSSRRTRFYTNYEGKRIMMDPCNWPSHHDFVLIGT